jgi:hypothetical protein
LTMRNPLIIAALLIIAYGLLVEYGPKPAQVKTQSQWQNNLYAIEKYFRVSKTNITQPEVVFVGSSLTTRLDFDGEPNCVYNLSLGGESALTGLNVIENSVGMPRLVFVEINFPDHTKNQKLIETASGFLPQLSAIFHIENIPINLAVSYLYQLNKNKPANEVNEAVLQSALVQQTQSFKFTISSDTLKNSMAEFSRLAGNIESKGAKIIFFELPIHPELEYSARAMQVRSAFKSTFPNYQLVDFNELTKGGVIRTVDGVHLSGDDAKIVSRNIKVHFDEVCANQKIHRSQLPVQSLYKLSLSNSS